mmetsp:Transcript_5337/g.6124  ORF Transcript_5337/g.6124 Transcript_5337/m.6124 type:complete len:201 (-) Transcript_5337:287-889(-)
MTAQEELAEQGQGPPPVRVVMEATDDQQPQKRGRRRGGWRKRRGRKRNVNRETDAEDNCKGKGKGKRRRNRFRRRRGPKPLWVPKHEFKAAKSTEERMQLKLNMVAKFAEDKSKSGSDEDQLKANELHAAQTDLFSQYQLAETKKERKGLKKEFNRNLRQTRKQLLERKNKGKGGRRRGRRGRRYRKHQKGGPADTTETI